MNYQQAYIWSKVVSSLKKNVDYLKSKWPNIYTVFFIVFFSENLLSANVRQVIDRCLLVHGFFFLISMWKTIIRFAKLHISISL